MGIATQMPNIDSQSIVVIQHFKLLIHEPVTILSLLKF